jgi:flagellar motor switch protein FliN/FliY
VNKADFQQLAMNSTDNRPQNIDLLMDVDLPVSIELGRTKMSISEILAMGPGSIIELDKLVGEPVDLLVNQKCVARGEVVVVEESFGLRITQLMSAEERIKNL